MKPTAETGYSKLEWFFYIIFLPILFVSILTVVLLWFLDFDVKTKILEGLNKIPVVEKLIDDQQFNNSDKLTITNNKEQLQNKITDLTKTLDDKTLELTKTQQQLTSKDDAIKNLNGQIIELQNQLNEKNQSDETREQQISNLAKVYANMSARSAAGIIQDMTSEEAVLVLEHMKIDEQSAILEKMDPQHAADISVLLKDAKYTKDQDISALQKRIAILVSEIDKLKTNQVDDLNYGQVAVTYGNMDPQAAADALIMLSGTDFTKAKNILKAMDPISRSNILSKMTPTNAAKFTSAMINE